ncbi:MAG: hypothetical protein R3230_00470 [Nitrosopumilaceae archaeon]|nr:hypothetical protein [Nitrosopumilaceae archaeon]
MSNLPRWVRKPKHKENVVATERGWEVEKTNELLISHRNLASKLKEFFSDAEALKNEVELVSEPDIEQDVQDKTESINAMIDDVVDDSETDEAKKVEEKKEEKPKRRRGRPRKNAANK